MTTFLTLSNARCGSSHLITALDRIPGLRADFEVKWAMFYRPGPVHLPAGPGDNIAALVRQKVAPKAHNNGQVLGSKLVFDPYPRSFIDVDSANSLAEAIDPSVALIHLTRDYFA
ncbi:MAG: hypothetical protein VX098_08915, partial [Pseudomonadota bacterium]|nr:hypothetical protein [Pseudomonadota bacterium]